MENITQTTGFNIMKGGKKTFIKNPDYIIEANKENTGILLKEVEENVEKFKLVLRIAIIKVE